MNTNLRSFLALAAAIMFLAVVSACGSDPVAPNGSSSAPIDGAWNGSTSAYTTLQIDLTERVADHQLFGRWTGARANCAAKVCVDSGVVFSGARAGNAVTIGLTALNGTRSLAFTGTFDGAAITGSAALTDDGTHFPSEPLTLRR